VKATIKEVNMTPVGWIPLLGEFDVVEDEVRFHGKRAPTVEQPGGPETDQKDQSAVGLALSNLALADGELPSRGV